jgi:Uma2 family endonuclease
MADQVVATPPVPAQRPPEAEHRVSAEEYIERYAHDHYEWARGVLIEMTPINLRHDTLAAYLMDVFRAYFALRLIGVVLREPFVMRLDAVEAWREPDLQVILKSNPGSLTDNAMIGPADICVEIVTPESVARDYGEKFAEYEKAGVKEYWLVDWKREAALFYRLREEGVYKLITPDEEGYYQTPLLLGLRLHVPTLWQKELPDVIAIVDSVRAMIGAVLNDEL